MVAACVLGPDDLTISTRPKASACFAVLTDMAQLQAKWKMQNVPHETYFQKKRRSLRNGAIFETISSSADTY
jgi:hypothetical protein